MRRWGVGLAVLTVVMAACSAGGDDPPGRQPSPRPGLVKAWDQLAIDPIGQAVAAGDTVVVFGAVNNRDLYLYGVAVVDGSIRWRQPATPSSTTSGTPMTPSVMDGRVVYLRPDASGDLTARLVIASPETGADLFVSDAARFRSHPRPCPDKKDVCASVVSGRTSVQRRFSVGATATPVGPSAPAGSRSVGEDLLDLGGRQPETLAGFQNGSVRWQAPIGRFFSARFTTDRGWHFALYKWAGMHVGGVGHPPERDDTSTIVWDLSKEQTAGIDAATGAAVWRSDGRSYLCLSKVDLDRTRREDRGEPWPVRCAYRGTLRYDRLTETRTYEGLDVVMEGFDESTGGTTWSVPLGPAEPMVMDRTTATAVSDSEMLVPGGTGPVIVDLASGATRAPGKDEAFWCGKDAWFQYRTTPDGSTSDTWRGGTVLDICAADGSPTTLPPTVLHSSLGATVGERTVVATPRGLVAYDRR